MVANLQFCRSVECATWDLQISFWLNQKYWHHSSRSATLNQSPEKYYTLTHYFENVCKHDRSSTLCSMYFCHIPKLVYSTVFAEQINVKSVFPSSPTAPHFPPFQIKMLPKWVVSTCYHYISSPNWKIWTCNCKLLCIYCILSSSAWMEISVTQAHSHYVPTRAALQSNCSANP